MLIWALAMGVELLMVKEPWDELKGMLEMGKKVIKEKLSS